MDQEKTGRFIAACRKKNGFTQAALAEKLSITDRAVSKWETGKSLPDASIMLPLCELLGISVNELLTGERIAMDDYRKQAEENLVELHRLEEASNRRLLRIEKVLVVLVLIASLGLVGAGCLIAGTNNLAGLLFCLLGVAVVFLGAFVGVKIEHDAGYYECPECKERYVPTFKAVVLAPHIGTSRKMTCPRCGVRAYQKKVLTK